MRGRDHTSPRGSWSAGALVLRRSPRRADCAAVPHCAARYAAVRRAFAAARRRPVAAVLAAGLAAGLLGGCSAPPPPVMPGGPSVRVRSFTEASPVRILAVAEPYVFSAAERGLDRWRLGAAALGPSMTERIERLALSAEHGLPGDQVRGVAVDVARRWVWIATEGGIIRYDVAGDTFVELPPAPSLLGLGDLGGASLAPAADGGLWIGHGRGLFYTNADGQWTGTGVVDPVRALLVADDGWLWIGTTSGVIGREPGGATFRYGAEEGCQVETVRLLVRAPGGGPLIVGEDHQGQQRVQLMGRDHVCASFRVAPDVRWEAATARRDTVVVLGGGRLYEVASRAIGARALRRDGVRLVAVPGAAGGVVRPSRTPLLVTDLEVHLPPASQTLAAYGDDVLIGTRDMGVARLRPRGGAPTWLRTGELVKDAHALSVACASRSDCYVAVGTPRVWRFDGERFAPTGPGTVPVLAVARSPDGGVYAIYRSEDEQTLEVAKVAAGVWSVVEDVKIKTPGPRPEVSFARFSPVGTLWLGLRYRDPGGDLQPWGVAVVDLSAGVVAYHHETHDPREARKGRGGLPIPVDATDVAFRGDDEVWLATSEGAARVRGVEVALQAEASGGSGEGGEGGEPVRAIACAAGGTVFVGSRRGVSVFDGVAWSHPRALASAVNDLAIDRAGRLWLATARGVAIYDGRRLKRVNVRRGLLENEVAEIVVDEVGRIWARSKGGLAIITP